ncbi:hypothetical protein CQ12_05625 [Bradyrhizobium jicamae]|uniref:Uncharacterized protein n=1 Tax=Bradyrhizobium jicamae TaxID=280332 RepID=A0A0R3LTA3_9BRAD|nr:hypothetical protein [Bradyrhizobium jicamae]KRR11304.1 hypothetical protein CQ12_05625 [Bradyrhizobium jicamae]
MNKQVDDDISDAGRTTPFHIASDMEDDVQSIIDYGNAISRLAASFSDDEANMIARLSWQVVNHAKAVEHRQGLLFHALHPNRAELDAEAKASATVGRTGGDKRA